MSCIGGFKIDFWKLRRLLSSSIYRKVRKKYLEICSGKQLKPQAVSWWGLVVQRERHVSTNYEAFPAQVPLIKSLWPAHWVARYSPHHLPHTLGYWHFDTFLHSWRHSWHYQCNIAVSDHKYYSLTLGQKSNIIKYPLLPNSSQPGAG